MVSENNFGALELINKKQDAQVFTALRGQALIINLGGSFLLPWLLNISERLEKDGIPAKGNQSHLDHKFFRHHESRFLELTLNCKLR